MPEYREMGFSEICKWTEKQREASRLADTHQFFLFGGSRGPGKSRWLRWYLLWKTLKLSAKGILNPVVGLFCEDYPSLTDRQISKIEVEFPRWLGQVKDSKAMGFGFHIEPQYGGGVLALRNLDDPSKYQSAEFAAIGVDELTKNPLETFNLLRGSLRWPGIDKPQFVAATNPGSIGHGWVRALWIDRKFPSELLPLAPEFAFLPALPDDNPYLAPSYWQMLETLPETLRKAWRYGSWDAFEGQFFKGLDVAKQTIEPFGIPSEWNLIAAVDPGYSSPCAVTLLASDFSGNIYVVGVYYEAERNPEQNAEGVKQFFHDCKETGGRMPDMIVSGHDAWAKKDQYSIIATKKTFAEVFEDSGLVMEKATLDRKQGWWVIKGLLPDSTKPNDAGKLRFFRHRCTPLVQEMTPVMADPKDPEDIQGRGNDPKVPDHACLVAGTWVRMLFGERRIERIKPGDFVATRNGFRRVAASGITGIRRVETYEFENGRHLTCTSNHPIATQDGWTAAQDLGRKTVVTFDGLQSNNQRALCKSNQLWLMVLRFVGIQTRNAGGIGSTSAAIPAISSEGFDTCTDISTRSISVQSLKVITSTTRMGTHLTMPRRIWRLCLNSIISPSMAKQVRGFTAMPLSVISHLSDHSRKSGTDQWKATSGTGIMRLGELLRGLKNTVTYAARNSPALVGNAFAPMVASLNGEGASVSMMLNGHATNVDEYSRQAGIQNKGFVDEAVPVYNLAVEGENEFFANGILVHNCDSLRYGVMALYKPAEIMEKKTKTWEEELVEAAAGGESDDSGSGEEEWQPGMG